MIADEHVVQGIVEDARVQGGVVAVVGRGKGDDDARGVPLADQPDHERHDDVGNGGDEDGQERALRDGRLCVLQKQEGPISISHNKVYIIVFIFATYLILNK